MLICYLGPEGTSDLRAISLLRTVGDSDPLPMSSVSDVIETVNYTPGCLGIIPLENSTDGEISTNVDKLIFDYDSVYIREEVVLSERIDAFCVDPEAPHTQVLSHPQILDLCSQYIKQQGLTVRHTLSTAEACRTVSQSGDPTLVALAPPVVGEDRGLVPVSNAVMDVPDIRTRYVLIGREVAAPTGDDRSAIVITPATDRVGFLAAVTRMFAEHGINMNQILSRPLSAKLGNYCFVVIFEGHVTDPAVTGLLESLVDLDASVKLLGSYPRWRGTEVSTPSASLPRGGVDAQSSPAQRAALLAPPQAQPFVLRP